MMKVKCKTCLEKTEFEEFTEKITCSNCCAVHMYDKTDIRYPVGKTLTIKYKIYNKHRHINFKNVGLSFIIIVCSTIISLSNIEPKLNPVFLTVIILSTLYMLTKNNVTSYESSDPNIEKDIIFHK